MAKYKALFYREFIISKKLILTQAIAMICVMLFFWLVAMSMEFGNISNVFTISENAMAADFIMNKWSKMFAMYIFGFIVAFGTACVNMNNTPIADLNTNWRMYAFTLPVSSTEKALVELIMKITSIALSFVITSINFAALGFIFDIRPDWKFIVKIWSIFALLFAVMNFFTLPVIHRARTKKEAYLSNFTSVICGIVMIIAFTVIIKKPNSGSYYFNIDMDMLNIPQKYRLNISADELEIPIISHEMVNIVETVDLLGMLAFPLMILILMAGFFINRRMMERRYD